MKSQEGRTHHVKMQSVWPALNTFFMLVHSRHDGAQIISQLEKKIFFCWKNSNHLSCFDNGELKVELKLAWQNSLCVQIVCQVI